MHPESKKYCLNDGVGLECNKLQSLEVDVNQNKEDVMRGVHEILGIDLEKSVDLVLVNTPLRDYGSTPRIKHSTLPVLGLGYIATVAAEAGFNVGVLDAEANGMSFTEVADSINSINPRWVGFNLLAPTSSVRLN
jgi:hypothetical protein